MTVDDWLTRKREAVRRLGPLDIRALTPSIHDFHHAVSTQRRHLSVTVELARRTPEEGELTDDVSPERWAALLDDAEVAAIALAVDDLACGGSEQDMLPWPPYTTTPLLARDLVVSREQVYRARLLGADAVLLTAAAVSPHELRALLEIASSLHLSALVEVDTPEQLEASVAVGARQLVFPAFGEGGVLELERAQALLGRLPRTALALVRGPFSQSAQLDTVRGKADGVWICGPVLRAEHPAELLRPLVAAAENG